VRSDPAYITGTFHWLGESKDFSSSAEKE